MFLVCGDNGNYQLGRHSNNTNLFNNRCVSPLCNFQVDPFSISSISFYTFHTIWVTKDGHAYAIGSNENNQISETILDKILKTPKEIVIKSPKGNQCKILSAVCGCFYTLYLVSSKDFQNGPQLAYIHQESKKITFLNINGHKPISLFGGYETAAAIDSEGSILIVTKNNLTSNEIQASPLPGGEKAVKVACCQNFFVALSEKGKVFISPYKGEIQANFSELSELRGINISDISGSSEHCFAVSQKGQIFGLGSNENGRLGIGKEINEFKKFTEIKSLRKYNFVAAYSGGNHSLFQTSSGELYVCGTNRCGQLPIEREISDEIIYTPIKAISGGVTFCITGGPITGIFIGTQPPLNIPNKRINTEQKQEKEETIESLKKEISILKQKIKPINQEPNKIQILEAETIRNMRKIRELGSGATAKVLEVGKEEIFALKVMHINEISFKTQKKFVKEYEIINMLNHPNIIKTYGILLNDEKMPPSILLEYCPTNLNQLILKYSPSKVQIILSIYQIAEGMKYIHKCKVIHCDLKPSNILIGNDGIIKISDFGISKLISPDESSSNIGAGTQKFMAPEILNELDYNEKVDVYSFGVILYFMLSKGEMPKITVVQVGTGKKAKIPSSFTKLATKIINSCWNFEPKDRPSFDTILELFESNEYKLFDLDSSEIDEIRNFIKLHKEKIPIY